MLRRTLERIQELIRKGEYELTDHALDEAKEDDLHTIDLESAILTGGIVWIQRGDRRGTKFVIHGHAADLRTKVGVVVRFSPGGRCVMITVYAIEER